MSKSKVTQLSASLHFQVAVSSESTSGYLDLSVFSYIQLNIVLFYFRVNITSTCKRQ